MWTVSLNVPPENTGIGPALEGQTRLLLPAGAFLAAPELLAMTVVNSGLNEAVTLMPPRLYTIIASFSESGFSTKPVLTRSPQYASKSALLKSFMLTTATTP